MVSPAISQSGTIMNTGTLSPRQNGTGARPPLVKKPSSQSSHGASPAAEHYQPQRHAVARGGRHARLGLPRNHSSGRNLAKLGRQAQTQHAHQAVQPAEDSRRHSRHRSQDADSAFRLPGSLDESQTRPPMRRNLTNVDLARNAPRSKMKKNLSHGQLTRLNHSSKNLSALGPASHKATTSSKRPKSAEIAPQEVEMDLHEQEVEILRQQQERKAEALAPKKVGFAVGSSGDTSEGDEVPDMEGSGLQDDDWTDQSASASPYSTRQNTANNSRRASVITDKPPDRVSLYPGHQGLGGNAAQMRQAEPAKHVAQQPEPQAIRTPTPSDQEEDAPSPRSAVQVKKREAPAVDHEPTTQHALPAPRPRPSQPATSQPRVPQYPAKEHPNPTMKRLTSSQHPAPALVSSVSALDSMHSSVDGSPAQSVQSSRSNLAGGDGINDHEDELVSRFIPSASHPSTTASGANTGAYNTPRQGSMHTPDEESTLHRAKTAPFQVGPVSPGSTISGSSGAVTPALGRSRIELRMLHDKALADREAAAERQPLVPHHVYDRRNETLKSYLNLAKLEHDGRSGSQNTTNLSLGPEIFQGRFKAVNTELKVIQKFRDPIIESVERLRKCRGTKLYNRSHQKQASASAIRTSKSAISLPTRPASSREPSKLSTSTSPPKHPMPTEMSKSVSPAKSAMPTAKSAVHVPSKDGERRHPRRGVSFAGPPPQQTREAESEDANDPDAIARSLWQSLGA